MNEFNDINLFFAPNLYLFEKKKSNYILKYYFFILKSIKKVIIMFFFNKNYKKAILDKITNIYKMHSNYKIFFIVKKNKKFLNNHYNKHFFYTTVFFSFNKKNGYYKTDHAKRMHQYCLYLNDVLRRCLIYMSNGFNLDFLKIYFGSKNIFHSFIEIAIRYCDNYLFIKNHDNRKKIVKTMAYINSFKKKVYYFYFL
uniref:Uncharacterized protein n=1 Tax=Lotharella vacuolata TaxID=74820 RepID=A0A0H5BQW3_9EUKA|nr:hypothetical protein [Lotharella vacuolata]